SATVGWVTGANSVVLRTDDGGETWVHQMSGVLNTVSLKDVKFADATRAVAVGSGGVVLKSSDGGGGANITTNTLNGVAFANATRGWTVGDAGTMFLTNDAGDTWTQLGAV